MLLRETIKAKREQERYYVNATSTFLVNRLPIPETCSGAASHSLQGSTESPTEVLVAICRSQDKRPDAEDGVRLLDNFTVRTGS